MGEEAFCYQVTARCRLGMQQPLRAVQPCERACALAGKSGDWDRMAEALIDLATAYGDLRRFSRQREALEQYLELSDRLTTARQYEGTARYMLGKSSFYLGSLEQAIQHLEAALSLAEVVADEAGAERCRRLLRSALLGAGRNEPVRNLLVPSAGYIASHADDRDAAFWYWHATACLANRSHQTTAVGSALRRALIAAGDHTGRLYAWHGLRYQMALESDRPANALRYAMEARMTAIAGNRYDLVFESAHAMDQLLERYGAPALEQLEADAAQSGYNLFQYLPEQPLRKS